MECLPGSADALLGTDDVGEAADGDIRPHLGRPVGFDDLS